MRLSYEPRQLRRVTDAREFGHVAVLFGGDSSEREISLLSGNAVLDALKRRGVDAHAFDPRATALSDLIARRFDRVWIALHGPGGEDGTLQGALEYLGVPYTGSGVMGSAIGMDKLRTKRLALAVGVATADFVVLRARRISSRRSSAQAAADREARHQGSSVGMTKVERAADLPAAYALAVQLETLVFAEAWIPGPEYTVAVLQEARPALDPHRDAQDLLRLRGEVFPRRHALLLPVRPLAQRRGASRQSRARRLRGRRRLGLGRVDFMMERRRQAVAAGDQHRSGMTGHSLVPWRRARSMSTSTTRVARARDQFSPPAASSPQRAVIATCSAAQNRRKTLRAPPAPAGDQLALPRPVGGRAGGDRGGGERGVVGVDQPIETVAASAPPTAEVAPVDHAVRRCSEGLRRFLGRPSMLLYRSLRT